MPAARPSETAKAGRPVLERGWTITRLPSHRQEKMPLNPGDYRVKSGDSLTKIATEVKPDGVSLDQMLVALYRANPSAFVGNNMNRLRAGQVMSVPDAGTAGAIGNGEARGIIVAQAADFNEYRNKLAGQVANAAPQKAVRNQAQTYREKPRQKSKKNLTPSAESGDGSKLTS